MRSWLGVILLGTVLSAPVVMNAQEKVHRYYDSDRKDYHEWNEGEQRAWEHWLHDERHRDVHDFARANNAERREYWRWRHDHADWH